MSGVAGISNLTEIATAFETAVQDAFDNRPPLISDMFAVFASAEDAQQGKVAQVDTNAAPAEWLGPKVFQGMRAQAVTEGIRRWHRSLRIGVDDIRGNPSMVSRRLQQLAAEAPNMRDYVVLSAASGGPNGNSAGLLNNPTGYDAVSLMNNSHPNVGGSGTSDNLEAAALTRSLVSSSIQKLREMKDEAGEPISGGPTHLLVGTAQEEYARELTGSDKPVAVDESGDLDQGSGGVGAVNIRNFMGGNMNVLVSSRITGNEWFMMDLSSAARRPIIVFEYQQPEVTIKDQPDDDNVFHEDQILFSIVYKATPMALDWHTIVGSVTA